MKAFLLSALGCAAATALNHSHHCDASMLEETPIIVTINPESRVGTYLSGNIPPPGKCGAVIELGIKVVNQGFITAPLRAQIVGDGARYVSMHMNAVALSGQTEELRTLEIVPRAPDPADVTIAFSIDRSIGDLDGRDRVHLIVRCSAA